VFQPVEDVATQASVVLANATLYPETASRLSSLQTLKIPPSEGSAMLNNLSHELNNSRQRQGKIEAEIDELRQRSARCLDWWVNNGVLGMGALWEEWDARVVDLERRVAAFERQQKDEEGYI
jgi:hypothetical protein